MFSGFRFTAARSVVSFLAAGLAVASCAGPGAAPGGTAAVTDEQVVLERAQKRWNAVIAGDVKTAYGYLSPGTRELNKPEAYAASLKAGFWKKVVVEKVDCPEKDRCDAHLQVEYVHRGAQVTTPMRESWIRSDGNWWYVLK